MNTVDEGKIRLASPLLKGLLYSIGVMAACALLASFMLMLTGQKEDSLTSYTYAIHAISVVVGGFAAGRKSGSRGWYAGGITAVLYSLLVFLVAFLGFDRGISTQGLLFVFVAFLVGAIGGMLGVNTRK